MTSAKTYRPPRSSRSREQTHQAREEGADFTLAERDVFQMELNGIFNGTCAPDAKL